MSVGSLLDVDIDHNSNGNGATAKIVVAEMIGRTAPLFAENDLWRNLGKSSVDATKTDYEFWDKLRRGKQPGYELGALFCKPITNILISSILGDSGVEAVVIPPVENVTETQQADIEYTNKSLNQWLNGIYGQLITTVDDLYSLADQYVIMNPDGSISVASPDTVKPEFDPLDYRKPIKYTITTKLEKVEIKDIYTATQRELRIKNTSADTVTLKNGRLLEPQKEISETFSVLVGRIPVVQLSNDRSGNELFGHPIYEPLLTLFSEYNDLLKKALVGTKLMGNPIPVFEGMEDVEATIAANSRDDPDQYNDIDGLNYDRPRLILDEETILFLGKGGQFRFASPTVGFTEDVRSTLNILFLLMLQFARIPETAWGGQMGQARSTSVEQMKPFHQFIRLKRIELERMGGGVTDGVPQNGLLAIIDLWLRTKALTDPRIQTLATKMRWPSLSLPDEKLNLEKTEYAHESSLVTDATTLKLLNLKGVDDPKAEVEEAKEELEKKREEFDLQLEKAGSAFGDGHDDRDAAMNEPRDVPDDERRAKQPEANK